MTRPTLAVLPEELCEVQRRWREADPDCRDALYVEEFAEPFAKLFSELPLHGGSEGLEKPLALISVLGLSWQPVALMAAWCKPQRMLVLGTEESLALEPGGEGVLSLIARIADIKRDVISDRCVGDPGEADIYRAVRDFLRQSAFPARRVFVDPTGGKKSMSASAALAGFLAGAPLVYVDYAEYQGRSPVPGTEYPRLLTNPLEILGDLEVQGIAAAFNRNDFEEAERLALRLAERLYEPREAECLAKLARGYGAWDRFDFGSARDSLLEACNLLDRFADQGGWIWAQAARERLEGNIRALEPLTKITKQPERIEDGLALLVWYLARADRLLHAGEASLALLLTYAAIERYINLCLWVDFGLDDEKPDYARVRDRLAWPKYHDAGRKLVGNNYQRRDLEGPLMFTNGAQLLVALPSDRLHMNDLGLLKGLSAERNKCEYEHGFLPTTPSQNDVERYLEKARELVGRLARGDVLSRMLDDDRFPRLPLEADAPSGPRPS